jgi:flap endonuclease-1
VYLSVELSKLVVKNRISLEELSGRTLAIDAYNVLYQFLSIIRQPDGTPLMNNSGNVTSHISGLFYRTIELVGSGIMPIYVFDGIPSVLKQKTIEYRMRRREAALDAWKAAKEAGDVEEARKHAQASTRINKYIVESSKELLKRMGIPYINAPSEGEAEACYMCKKGMVYAAVSQDYDTLLLGSPIIIRNLTISGRRKLPKKDIYVEVVPEILLLDDTLKSLGISQRQLIWVGILLGTDFNDGITGVGPKTAVKIAKASNSIEDVKKYVKAKYNAEFELDIREVEELFLNPEVCDPDSKALGGMLTPSREALLKFMCDENGFSEERVLKSIEKLVNRSTLTKQHRIDSWM